MTVGVVALTWWVIYGRTTPFPALWYSGRESPQFVWFGVAVVAMTVALVALYLVDPLFRWASPIGVVAWLVFSTWSTQRDRSGLTILAFPGAELQQSLGYL